jgi:son of sevenless-like protein
MANLLETVNDALREVLEAAVAGSAAEEEMSRASDLRSASGFADAIRREDIAADALHIAHKTLLKALRDLLRAFGYIGPIDRIEGMPRPGWTSDMTLIGSIGVFASNVHAATTSKKASLAFTAQSQARGQQGSAWQDVSRSAYRLRDVLGRFPEMVIAEAGTIAIGETPFGKELECWIGAKGAGELCNGRWGFGGMSISSRDPATRDELKAGRKLDQAMVQEAKHVQAEFDSVIRGQDARRSSASTGLTTASPGDVSIDDVLELLRIAERFNGAIHHVDIASIIDLDGEQPQLASSSGGLGETARNDDLRAYADFVEQGRLAVVDFDKATADVNKLCAEVYLALCNDAIATIPDLSQSLASALLGASRSLGAILAITAEQATLTSTTPIVGRIGHRSARFAVANASSTSQLKSGQFSGYSSEQRDRPESMSSLASRGSGRSRGSKTSRLSGLDGMRNRVRGIEDDFQDSEQLMDPHNSPAKGKKGGGGHGRSGMSNSGSQSSLNNMTRPGQARDASAESSSASLPGHSHNVSIGQRTESDSGSLRGNNRTSFMKSFMRGRSDSDAERESAPLY